MSEFSWMLEERTDEELQGLKMKNLVEKGEHESKLRNIDMLLSDINKELEMRDLAGGHAELKHFRDGLNKRKAIKKYKEELSKLEAEFEAQGGRGVALAEQIDSLRKKLSGMQPGHCMHSPKCIGVGEPDERDPMGCCNCGTREKERTSPAKE